MLGVVSIRDGKPEAAVDYLQRAIAVDRADASFHNHLGVAFAGVNELPRAIECFQHALELDPQLADADYNLGNALRSAQRAGEAVAHYQAALKTNPNSAQTHYNLANTFRDLGRLEGAVASYEQALRIKPDYVKASTNLGNVFRKQKRFDRAEECHREALRLKPDYSQAYCNLASLAAEQGRSDEAEADYREALQIEPNLTAARSGLCKTLIERARLDEAVESLEATPQADEGLFEAYLKLADKLRTQGRFKEALAWTRIAVETKPDEAIAHDYLGLALAANSELEEAAASYRQALQIQPDSAVAHNNLAVALQFLEQRSEAMEHIEMALRIKPSFAVAHLNRAVTWLRAGDFRQGWLEFEWRRHCKDHRLRRFGKPLWTGEAMPDRTILVHAEQGLGDTIQFIRYAPLVNERFANVIVEGQKPLCRLLVRCPGIDRLVARGEELPDYDVQAPLMSLPGIFGTTLTTVPVEVPYIFPDENLIRAWRERLSTYRGFKVGIAWQGGRQYAGDAYRSLPLRHFAPIARVDGVRLFSLQKGPGSEQLADLPDGFTVADFGPELDTASGAFTDTAAVMRNLNLVITSDTAIPHLAGAMGVPVWVALNSCADWRWLDDREDSPWYPTMRLFRQSRLGDWDGLFARIAEELGDLIDGRYR